MASLRAEKTVLLAVAVQLAVAALSSFLFVGLVALYAPGGAAGAGVVVDVGVTGTASGTVAPVVAEGESRVVTRYPNRSRALAAFQRGTVDAVLVGTARPDGGVAVEAVAPDGDFRTTLVVVQLRDALAALERTLRDRYADRLVRQPVPTPPAGEGGGSPFFGFAYTVLVPLLVLLPAFISGSVVVDSLTEELERGTLELLRVAPVSPGAVVDGKALAAVGIAPLEAVAWLALLAGNGTTVAHPLALVVVVTALALLFAGLGAGLAVGLADRRSGQLLYSLGSLGIVGAATLLPQGPVNAVARLAVGSPDRLTWVVVGGLCLAAVLAYLAGRRVAVRTVGPA